MRLSGGDGRPLVTSCQCMTIWSVPRSPTLSGIWTSLVSDIGMWVVYYALGNPIHQSPGNRLYVPWLIRVIRFANRAPVCSPFDQLVPRTISPIP
jgi:hypothetical protein